MAHKTAAGNISGAWRELEKTVAQKFREAGFRRAKRIVRNDDFGEERPDVDVPEIKTLAVDTKYKNGGFAHHTLFVNEVDKYRGKKRFQEETEYSWAIMPTRSGKSKDIFVTLRLEHFLDVLARAFLRNKGGGWSCPRCPDEIEKTGEVMGLSQFTCKGCSLVLLSQEDEGEAYQPPVKKKKEPRTVVKDHSKESGYVPQPGQMTLQDLIAKKKAMDEAKAQKAERTSQKASKKK